MCIAPIAEGSSWFMKCLASKDILSINTISLVTLMFPMVIEALLVDRCLGPNVRQTERLALRLQLLQFGVNLTGVQRHQLVQNLTSQKEKVLLNLALLLAIPDVLFWLL